MDRRGNFAYKEGDPYVRTYSIGDAARRDVVRMSAEADYVSCDIETDGLAEESYTVKVIIISTDMHSCVLNAFDPQHVEAAKDAISVAKWIAFHNSPFDCPPLYNAGVLSLKDIDKVVDTLIIANMAIQDSFGGRGLGDLERTVLGISAADAAKDRFKQWAKVNGYKISEAFKKVRYEDPAYAMYAGWDGIVTHRIVQPLLDMAMKQLTEHPFGRYGADESQAQYLIGREQIVNRVMLKRSCIGLAIDPLKLQAEQDRLLQIQNELGDVLNAYGVERPTAPADLINALSEAGAIPDSHPRTATGKYSTAAKNLSEIDHPAAKAFTGYGDNNRVLNYLESARRIAERTDGRLHPVVGIMKAVTGRMSYSNPALQQFVASAREMIVFDGEEGSSIDWSQIEPVLLANLSGDTGPLEIYEHSGDLYQGVAQAAGIARSPSKTVLLGGMYGQGPDKLSAQLSRVLDRTVTVTEAEQLQAKVRSGMPRSWNMIDWCTEWSRITGKTWTVSGRIVDVHPMFAYRGPNYTIQGSGYDLMAETIVEMHRRGMDSKFYLAFHDEMIVSKDVAQEVVEIMSTPPARLVDLIGRTPVLRVDRADLGDRWRTLPKSGADCCGSETSVRWVGDKWLCGQHQEV